MERIAIVGRGCGRTTQEEFIAALTKSLCIDWLLGERIYAAAVNFAASRIVSLNAVIGSIIQNAEKTGISGPAAEGYIKALEKETTIAAAPLANVTLASLAEKVQQEVFETPPARQDWKKDYKDIRKGRR